MISNKVKLQNLVLSKLAIPDNGGIADAIGFLANPENQKVKVMNS